MVIASLSCCNSEHSSWLLLSQADISAEHSDSFTILHHVLTKKELSVVVNKKFDNSSCANNLKWGWMSVEVEVKVFEEVKKERIRTRFWKVLITGVPLNFIMHTTYSVINEFMQ